MRITNPIILVLSLIVAVIVTAATGIPVRWIWSSPGGSAYGIGFPVVYQWRYCGGYAPCYWDTFYYLGFIEDLAVWFIVAAVVVFALRKGKVIS